MENDSKSKESGKKFRKELYTGGYFLELCINALRYAESKRNEPYAESKKNEPFDVWGDSFADLWQKEREEKASKE